MSEIVFSKYGWQIMPVFLCRADVDAGGAEVYRTLIEVPVCHIFYVCCRPVVWCVTIKELHTSLRLWLCLLRNVKATEVFSPLKGLISAAVLQLSGLPSFLVPAAKSEL